MERIYTVLSLFIGAGVFLVGIVMFSDCLEKYASRGKSALFKKISDNHLVGFGVGAVATAIIQSSAATIITVMGLVSAGILTLVQAAFIILGAHIGNTSTLFFVSLSFFDIRYLFMAMGFLGALMKIISKDSKIVKIADLMISCGILFVGLNLMSGTLRNNEELRAFFIHLFARIEFPPVLILLGMVFTMILQSSTAATSLFLMMIGEGILSFEGAMYLALGAIIGTSFTPIFASLASNTKAKRTALLNLLFSVISVIVFTGIVWPLKSIIIPAYEHAIPLAWQYPVFMFAFHLFAAVILIWFIAPLSQLTCLLLKEKPDSSKEQELSTLYIDDFLLSTPSLAVEQTKKEIQNMMTKTRANMDSAFNALINHDLSEKKKIKKEENSIDFINRAIADFIIKLSGGAISEGEMIIISSFRYVIKDIERVGDYAYKMLKDANRMNKNNIKFSKKAVKQLQTMFSKVMELFDLSMDIFESRDPEKQSDVHRMEAEIEELNSKMALSHLMWLKAGQYFSEGGEYFYSAISNLKRVTDRLANVAFSAGSFQDKQLEEEPVTE